MSVAAAALSAACDDDSSHLVATTTAYTVSFDLQATSGPVGALQFDVEYRGGSSHAGWVGAGHGVACRWFVQAAIHACNAKRDSLITCAVVDTGGFAGPTPLLECEFAAAGDEVSVRDFEVRVTDASTPDLQPIEAEVSVSAVVPGPDAATTTTDPADPPDEYDVVFEIPYDSPEIGSLRLDITHEGIVGGWVGSGLFVGCAWLVVGEVGACYESSNQLLTCTIGSSTGFSGPLSILECAFATYETIVEASDFRVRVVDASSPEQLELDVVVQVESVTLR
jgi:hypothetical protein